MKLFVILSALLISQVSSAQTVLGSACDQSTAKIQVNGQQTRVKVSMSKYRVASSGKPIQRGTCNLALPVEVPAGKQLVISKIRVAEAFSLGSHTKSSISVAAFFPGQVGEVLSQSLGNPSGARGRLVLSKRVNVVSECGQSTIVRFNSSITLMSHEQSSSADHAEISSVELSLKLVDC